MRRLYSTLGVKSYDAIVIGGGHNGLVAAAYLAKAGKRVAVLERRHVLGGAAVTEEIIPGYKFSRASYALSLLRPQIANDLELKKHGLKVYHRDYGSFTPIRGSQRSLILGTDEIQNCKHIAQFSPKDAQVYLQYKEWMERMSKSIKPLLDSAPINLHKLTSGSLSALKPLVSLTKAGTSLGKDTPSFLELCLAPAAKVLENWFESDILKSTLAADAITGQMCSPKTQGSGYVLLHHTMGGYDGGKTWCYVEGGMGSVSMAIAKAAQLHGAELHTEKPVQQIIVKNNVVEGVLLQDGTVVRAKTVLSNATPKVTFFDLLSDTTLPDDFKKQLANIDYSSPATKINVALRGLPNFIASPNTPGDPRPGPHHQCLIFLNCESIETIHQAYLDCLQGEASSRPYIEMCMPSSLDPTLAPEGCHVLSLFTQYTPYQPAFGPWNDENKEKYCQKGIIAEKTKDPVVQHAYT
ncbi:hypothetical protein EMCRGX_G029507 [Ephydatia muelleri]